MSLNRRSIAYKSGRLAIAAALLQLLGFCYRILLGRLAGAQVIAVHGLVMSAYNVILAVTLTGIAFSVSRIAARYDALGSGKSIRRLISLALALFLGLFLLLSIPFLIFRNSFAEYILGSKDTAPALLLLIPCLFLTGFENVHKAFFYGTGRTLPPMISETLEMLCRIVAALLLFKLFPELPIPQAAALILLAMILSEVVSAGFLTLCYRIKLTKLNGRDDISRRCILRDIGDMALPISLSTLISRMLSATNTVLIPRCLILSGISETEAMEQFGLLFGMTLPMLMLPAALLQPLITVLTPHFTAAHTRHQFQDIRRKAAKGLHVCGIFAIPILCVMVGYGEFLAEFLYQDVRAAKHLLPLAINTFLGFYYIVCESVLEGIGQQRRSAALAVIATASGVLLTLIIGTLFRGGIYAYLIGELASSTFGVIVSLIWMKRYTGIKFRFSNWLFRPLLATGVSYFTVRPLFSLLCEVQVWQPLVFVFCLSLTLLIYSLSLRLLGVDFENYIKGISK